MTIRIDSPDEWRKYMTTDCVYGELKIQPDVFSVRVESGLCIFDEDISSFFSEKDSFGFVGNCVFVFVNYSAIKIDMAPYILDQNGNADWFEGKIKKYVGDYKGKTVNYGLEGTLNFPSYCPAWIDIECDAERLELHILDATPFEETPK
jgi:hypothetical protein